MGQIRKVDAFDGAHVLMDGEAFPPKSWVESDGEMYLPYTRNTDATHHILRGACDAPTYEQEDGQEAGICGATAKYRRINDEGVEDRCGRHVPGNWKAALSDHDQLDDTLIKLNATCCRTVKNEDRSGGFDGHYVETSEGRSAAERDITPRVHECGDQAFVMLTDGERYAKAYCKQHARKDWYRFHHIDAGHPHGRHGRLDGRGGAQEWPDEVDPEACYYVDGPSRQVFETYDQWREAMSGVYADVLEADDHLIILSDSGEVVSGL